MRNLNRNIFLYCFIIAILFWLLPFSLVVCFTQSIENNIVKKDKTSTKTMDRIFSAISENNNEKVFILILENNAKGCIVNIIGGATIGAGTIMNTAYNGAYSAYALVNAHKSGMSGHSILKLTLPHSFELIGFWLSGSIGFYIAWNLIQAMRGNIYSTRNFFKTIGISVFIMFLIIGAAAYVEAYISTNYLQY